MVISNKKKKLYLMAGIPGSGKSTWIYNNLNHFSGTTKIVSRDEIRFSLLNENDDYFSKENEVYHIFIDNIKEGLLNCDNTIVDATHLNPSSRGKLLCALGSSIKDVEVNIIIIDTCLAKCLEQNEMREGRAYVPRSAIRRMSFSFQMPTIEEGFDNIYIYTKIGNEVTYKIITKE